MKNFVIALLALFSISAAEAQTVTQQPGFVAANAWTDVGNGPTEVMAVEGSAALYTASGSGTGSAANSTSLVLTAIPAVPPCVGCLLSAAASPSLTAVTIPAGAFIAAYNGVTQITMSTAVTATSAALAWGAACPTSGQPNTTSGLSKPLMLRGGAAGIDYGVPMYTQARVCAFGAYQQGATLLNFAIGAH